MRVLVLVKGSKASEADSMPSDELVHAMGVFNEELVKAGVMLAADGLHPSHEGKCVVYSGKQRKVIDGPFTESKEVVGGFWIWQVSSMEEALSWAERCPNPNLDDGIIEIRQIFDVDDFADAAGLSDETREQQRRLAQALADRQATQKK